MSLVKIKQREPAANRLADVDWELVERDYRTSQLSLRELQTRHGPSPQSILRRVAKHGWQRDLTKPIQAATRAAVVQAEIGKRLDVANSLKKASNVSHADALTVAAAAEIAKNVIMQHRAELAEGRLIGTELMLQLRELIATKALEISQQKELIQDGGDSSHVLFGFVKIYDKLISAVTRIHAAERVAHGLDDSVPDDDNSLVYSRMSPIERANRIEAILEKARLRRTESALGITLDESDGAWITKKLPPPRSS